MRPSASTCKAKLRSACMPSTRRASAANGSPSNAPFQAAVREIETCFEFALEASEPICVSLIGPSRTGKSRVLDVCEHQHPKVRREAGMYVPILRVTTPSKPTVKGLAEVLLEGL